MGGVAVVPSGPPRGGTGASSAAALQAGNPHMTEEEAVVLATYASALEK